MADKNHKNAAIVRGAELNLAVAQEEHQFQIQLIQSSICRQVLFF